MALERGRKAPDFELADQNGARHRLSDYRGGCVLLYFYPKVKPAEHAAEVIADVGELTGGS